jgi:transcriptional regulator with XRE-family HTH domain
VSRNGVRGEIREFLTTRRARITPEQAGLPNYGGKRRVPGLRREEVALLAGISIEYYTRLERGDARGVSEDVLDRIARALQLDDVERAHLVDLVRTAHATRPAHRRPTQQRVRPSVQRLLDSMTGTAAFVRNGRLDILSANQLGYALYSPTFLDPVRPVNLARFIYDALEIPADPGQTIVAYTSEPDSPSQQALDLLASWTSTPDEAPAGTAEYDS